MQRWGLLLTPNRAPFVVPQINQRHHLLCILDSANVGRQRGAVVDGGLHKAPHGLALVGLGAEHLGVFFADDGVGGEDFVHGADDEGLGAKVGDFFGGVSMCV